MAGDWIKLEVTTPDKPEVYRIAEILGIDDPDVIVGKLVRVWAWADQQTFDGNADSVTHLLLDRITGVTGFADAMIKCGWLIENGRGLTFPNFDRHNGKTAKTRALTRDRVAKSRNANVTMPALPREEKEKSNKYSVEDEQSVKLVFTLWNERATRSNGTLKTARTLGKERSQKIRARLRNPDWLPAFKQSLGKLPLPSSPGKAWQPDLSWIIENDVHVFEVVEGKFDWRGQDAGRPQPMQPPKPKTAKEVATL